MPPVISQSNIDSGNSSVTPLADAAVFTGQSRDVSGYATTTVFVDTDIDGTLSMQFSADNVNWDRAKVVPVDQEIGSGSVHTLEVVAQFFRVVFTNGTGGGAQAHFRLQTIHSEARSGFLTSSLDEQISKINDTQIVRVANDSLLDISRGLYADRHSIHKFGFNETVPSGSFADIWAYGPVDVSYNWPVATEGFRVRSGGNVADTSAGAGARTIQLMFLDGTGVQVQEQITLAGASASSSTSTEGRRIIRAWVDTVGTINSNNTGRIIIENDTTNEVVATIEAGIGQTEQTMYTVPLDHTAYLLHVEIDVSIGANKDADVRFWQRRDAYTTSAPFGAKRLVNQWNDVQGEEILELKAMPSFPALTDLWVEAQGNGAATAVDVSYDLILVHSEAAMVPQ